MPRGDLSRKGIAFELSCPQWLNATPTIRIFIITHVVLEADTTVNNANNVCYPTYLDDGDNVILPNFHTAWREDV